MRKLSKTKNICWQQKRPKAEEKKSNVFIVGINFKV
jgi:hypothetical protein